MAYITGEVCMNDYNIKGKCEKSRLCCYSDAFLGLAITKVVNFRIGFYLIRSEVP